MTAFEGVSFPDTLDLRYTGRGDEWELLRPFRCLWSGGWLEVPAGFINDLSSIPQAFQSAIPVVGPQNLPSVVHDYLYALQGRLPGRVFSRAEADALFLAGLEAAGVGWLKRRAMHSAVRVGGWVAWRG